jgi:hypothetical protein
MSMIELHEVKRAARWFCEWKTSTLVLTSPKYGAVVIAFDKRDELEQRLTWAA